MKRLKKRVGIKVVGWIGVDVVKGRGVMGGGEL